MIKLLMKVIGISGLLEYAWAAVRPELIEWAQSDGKEDWDDKLVLFLDEVIGKVKDELKQDGK